VFSVSCSFSSLKVNDIILNNKIWWKSYGNELRTIHFWVQKARSWRIRGCFFENHYIEQVTFSRMNIDLNNKTWYVSHDMVWHVSYRIEQIIFGTKRTSFLKNSRLLTITYKRLQILEPGKIYRSMTLINFIRYRRIVMMLKELPKNRISLI